MPLDVIGAGLGRTGTTSLKLALERLGFFAELARPQYTLGLTSNTDGSLLNCWLRRVGAASIIHPWHFPCATLCITRMRTTSPGQMVSVMS